MDRSKAVNENGYFINSVGKATNIADNFANNTIAEEQLIITSSSVVSLTNSIFEGAVKACMSVNGGNLRVRTSGNNPTITSGVQIHNGDYVELFENEIANFKAIAEVADVTIDVEYKN